MAIFNSDNLAQALALRQLALANPFTPQRVEAEQQVLGSAFDPAGTLLDMGQDQEHQSPNVIAICHHAETLAATAAKALAGGAKPTDCERAIYDTLILYLLYYRYHDRLHQAVISGANKPLAFYRAFADDVAQWLGPVWSRDELAKQTAHVFACLYQLRCAFSQIFSNIIGRSAPIAELRAAVWQSIFTHDIDRYRRVLFDRMNDYTTLITGPSGTGKELVARAIGLARYVPFNTKTSSFPEESRDCFFPINLTALSPTLIESELFGHKRGAFTGAITDRIGWFELCPTVGTVFLDEIGDLDAAIQVKLLRVLQSRQFERVGDTKPRSFKGKVIAATNQPLSQRIDDGSFREDFYYRLCSDIITTPSLACQLAQRPDELSTLVFYIAHQLIEEDAKSLADDVLAWIDEHLDRDYAWPGNVRELEQCVRNILIRRDYQPRTAPAAVNQNIVQALADDITAGRLELDDLIRRYCTLIYAETGSYEQTARRLGIDRRTVKSRIDPDLLDMIRQSL